MNRRAFMALSLMTSVPLLIRSQAKAAFARGVQVTDLIDPGDPGRTFLLQPKAPPFAVASWGPNRLDIFGLGTHKRMYHKA